MPEVTRLSDRFTALTNLMVSKGSRVEESRVQVATEVLELLRKSSKQSVLSYLYPSKQALHSAQDLFMSIWDWLLEYGAWPCELVCGVERGCRRCSLLRCEGAARRVSEYSQLAEGCLVLWGIIADVHATGLHAAAAARTRASTLHITVCCTWGYTLGTDARCGLQGSQL